MAEREAGSIPVVDVSDVIARRPGRERAAAAIGDACRSHGFFYVVGHGVDASIEHRLETSSRAFFAEPELEKMKIRMELGGRAWRGYFPVGAELTSGEPDRKEGLYFGAEIDARDPRVAAGTPLHGGNLFPSRPPELRGAVLAYMEAMTSLGHRLMEAIALSLGLEADYFESRYTREPLVLFRVFNYPSVARDDRVWSVGEHTDYGLLTILRQDRSGGLEVKRPGGSFIAAPPVEGSYVCNIGDMLDRMTSGRYRSTPHRVRNVSGGDRLSFAFFFDPAWDSRVGPVDPRAIAADDRDERWDRTSVHAFEGTYGDYLLGKVGKAFPHLGRNVLERA